MGKIWMQGGGGGTGSDDCTATRSELLKGYKAITKESDDEVAEGTLELTGTAADSQVLQGQTYYNTDPKGKRTGGMPNRGAVSQSLNAGGSYTIPAGYHNGSGKVTANSLTGQTSGTAAAGDILSGKTAWVNGNQQTGTMSERGTWNSSVGMNGSITVPEGHHSGSGKVSGPSVTQRGAWTGSVGMNGAVTLPEGYHNGAGKVSGPIVTQRGAVTASLNCGGSYTIPEGYHNGSGRVTANSLASQTAGATADDTKVLSGYTYWKDGMMRAGQLTVSSVVSFSAAQYSNLTLIASWANPSRGPWSGLRILCKQGGYPSSVSDGTLFYEGSGTSAAKQLAAGTWYFRAWNYITTNQGRMYGGYVQTTASNQEIRGQQTFTSSGVFTVPAAVRQIQAFVIGGGGGGGSGRTGSSSVYRGSGGGGGYTNTSGYVNVTPGQQITVTIGAGGAGGPGNTTSGNGSAGGTTTVSGIVSAVGGSGGGFTHQNMSGGNGGSGGGGSGYYSGGAGGSDGRSGKGGWLTNEKVAADSSGQGSTTRVFGETGGTLYAGGGAGKGGIYDGNPGSGGGGGADGGSGAAGTGGGGGGSHNPNNRGGPAAGNGGSGLAIIRWGY